MDDNLNHSMVMSFQDSSTVNSETLKYAGVTTVMSDTPLSCGSGQLEEQRQPGDMGEGDDHAIIESIDTCVAGANCVDVHLFEGDMDERKLNAVLRQKAYPGNQLALCNAARVGMGSTLTEKEQLSIRRDLQRRQPGLTCCTATASIDEAMAAPAMVTPSPGGKQGQGRDSVPTTNADNEEDFGAMFRDYELCADRSQVLDDDPLNRSAVTCQRRESTRGIQGVTSETGTIEESGVCVICHRIPESPELNHEVSTIAENGGKPQSYVTGIARLPCCEKSSEEKNSSGSQPTICTSCILILCTPTSNGDALVGRCPRCRTWITISKQENDTDRVVVREVDKAGSCEVCCQVKDNLVDDDVCDACYLGMRHPLAYECEQCNEIQRIPHPVYRYQDAVDKFGSASWACNGRCNNFTKWRILSSEIGSIPVGDAPEAWGTDYLSVARSRVLESHQMSNNGRGPMNPGNAHGSGQAADGADGDWGCSIS